jgi:hypothetical protein
MMVAGESVVCLLLLDIDVVLTSRYGIDIDDGIEVRATA